MPEPIPDKCRSNFTYVVDEYGKSQSGYAFAIILQEIGKKLFGRNRRR